MFFFVFLIFICIIKVLFKIKFESLFINNNISSKTFLFKEFMILKILKEFMILTASYSSPVVRFITLKVRP